MMIRTLVAVNFNESLKLIKSAQTQIYSTCQSNHGHGTYLFSNIYRDKLKAIQGTTDGIGLSDGFVH